MMDTFPGVLLDEILILNLLTALLLNAIVKYCVPVSALLLGPAGSTTLKSSVLCSITPYLIVASCVPSTPGSADSVYGLLV